MRRKAALTLLTLLVLPAMAAAGCSGGSAGAQPGRSPASRAAPAPSAPTLPATSAPGSAAMPSSAPPSSPAGSASGGGSGGGCESSGLRLALGATNGGAGHDQLIFTLRNASSSACSLSGYPSLTLIGDGADPLPTHVVRGQAFSFPDVAPKPVTIAPGGFASFDIDVSPVPTSGESQCPAASALRVTPPGATKPLRVRVDIAPCGHGTVHVSPVVAGSNGV